MARGARVNPWARSPAPAGPWRALRAARRAWICSGRVLGQAGRGRRAARERGSGPLAGGTPASHWPRRDSGSRGAASAPGPGVLRPPVRRSVPPDGRGFPPRPRRRHVVGRIRRAASVVGRGHDAWARRIHDLWRRDGGCAAHIHAGRDEADQGRGQVLPAIGGEDGGVEFVVELAQDRDQALFVDELSLGPRGSPRRSCSSTLYMPVRVNPGCSAWRALRWFSRSVGESADTGLLGLGGVGKGKGIEGLLVLVAGIVADPKPTACRDGPNGVDPAGQDPENERHPHGAMATTAVSGWSPSG